MRIEGLLTVGLLDQVIDDHAIRRAACAAARYICLNRCR
jgi:hypothetical protein